MRGITSSRVDKTPKPETAMSDRQKRIRGVVLVGRGYEWANEAMSRQDGDSVSWLSMNDVKDRLKRERGMMAPLFFEHLVRLFVGR